MSNFGSTEPPAIGRWQAIVVGKGQNWDATDPKNPGHSSSFRPIAHGHAAGTTNQPVWPDDQLPYNQRCSSVEEAAIALKCLPGKSRTLYQIYHTKMIQNGKLTNKNMQNDQALIKDKSEFAQQNLR